MSRFITAMLRFTSANLGFYYNIMLVRGRKEAIPSTDEWGSCLSLALCSKYVNNFIVFAQFRFQRYCEEYFP